MTNYRYFKYFKRFPLAAGGIEIIHLATLSLEMIQQLHYSYLSDCTGSLRAALIAW